LSKIFIKDYTSYVSVSFSLLIFRFEQIKESRRVHFFWFYYTDCFLSLYVKEQHSPLVWLRATMLLSWNAANREHYLIVKTLLIQSFLNLLKDFGCVLTKKILCLKYLENFFLKNNVLWFLALNCIHLIQFLYML